MNSPLVGHRLGRLEAESGHHIGVCNVGTSRPNLANPHRGRLAAQRQRAHLCHLSREDLDLQDVRESTRPVLSGSSDAGVPWTDVRPGATGAA